MKLIRSLDALSEAFSRGAAQRVSRRSFLSRVGLVMVGMTAIPVLPVRRGSAAAAGGEGGDASDETSCDYWRHCAIDGFLCSCCGGSTTQCPPGTEVSAVTWIGTCHNPEDGRDYLVSYNDCCGNAGCGRCFCHRNEGDTPTYMPARSNDINWCLGTSNIAYHCSLSVVLGLAADEE